MARVLLHLHVCAGAGCLANSAGHTGRTPEKNGRLIVCFLDLGQGDLTLFTYSSLPPAERFGDDPDIAVISDGKDRLY
ncbi:MAG: hypothetical protein METHP_02068 [Methanoregula sp. SKADARSKE-2]|nr:MAG: hypothetical protein METHP_02068 [Methanoregula sp. SKADARSKE-2]